MRYGQIKVAKEELDGTKKPINVWDPNVDNIVTSMSVKRKTNSNYMIGYLDNDIRPLDLILPKMSGYVKTFKDKGEDNNNKLMSLRIDDDTD